MLKLFCPHKGRQLLFQHGCTSISSLQPLDVCLPEARGRLLTFSSSRVVCGPSMLLSRTLQQPTRRLHASPGLLALIKHSRRETEKVEVFCSSEAEALLPAAVRDASSPHHPPHHLVLLRRSVDSHNACQCVRRLCVFSRLSH